MKVTCRHPPDSAPLRVQGENLGKKPTRTTSEKPSIALSAGPECLIRAHPCSIGVDGVTRTELLVILAVLALLTLALLPALANNRPRSASVICANNLRQIGMAMQLWGNDHDDTTPQETLIAQGGTRGHALAANVWLHFSWISNELASPKLLLCPSDSGSAARDFTGDPTGGYLNPNFANRATTYFLGYRAANFMTHLEAPIAGDRNLSTSGVSGCPQFNTGLAIPTIFGSATTQWAPGLHGSVGNILIWDGHVVQANSERLQKLFTINSDNATKHIITPR